MIRRIKNWLRKYESQYGFTSNDVYIFHDVETALAFTSLYSHPNTILVYHQQGSPYGEWSAFTGSKSVLYHHFLLSMLKKAVSRTEYVCFPSDGARNELILNEPDIAPYLAAKKSRTLYNGFNLPDDQTYKADLLGLDSRIRGRTVFATVARLNAAKAAERIPSALSVYKEHDKNFVWVLMGGRSDE